jgi:large repetitive protein
MRIITLFSALLLTGSLCAEHLPGGNITYECISGNQYRITLHLWRECSGSPIIPQDLAFANDCGVSFELTDLDPVSVEDASPVCADEVGQTTCNGGTLIGIELYTYETTLFLSPCDHWTISWSTCCRAASVNLVLTQGTYIEAMLDNSSGDCIDSPTFSQNRVPFACVGQPVSYDLGVAGGTAADLRFRLIGARRNTSLVEPVLYEAPYTGEEPYTGMEIDSLNGNITFTPMEQGYVVVVVEVSMYDDAGNWIGSVMRDFPFVVQACSNNVPDAASGTVSIAQGAATATGAYAAATCSGSPFCMEMEIVDIDPGQELTLTSNASTNLPGATMQFSGSNPVLATLCWDPAGAAVGVYTFTIYAQDDACPVFGTQTYAYSVAVAADGGDAGADATVPLCLETSVNLSDYLTGDPGGVWSAGPVVGASGTYTYTVATGCGSDVATFTVEDVPSPDAGDDASGDLCAGSTLDLSTLLNGDDGGSWSSGAPIVDLGGMYTYTVTNQCGSDIAEFTVFQFDPPNAGEDVEIDVCPNAPPFLLMDSLGGSPEPGGVWLYLGVVHSPTMDPAVDPQGNYCYTLTGEPPCTIGQACVRVTLLPPTDPYCISLGIPSGNRSGLSVLPNPSHGVFQVQGSEYLRSLELTDAQGRLVWSTSPLAGQPNVSIVLPGSLADGMYLLRAQDAHGSWSVQRVELLR